MLKKIKLIKQKLTFGALISALMFSPFVVAEDTSSDDQQEAKDVIEILYLGNKEDMAFLGLGQALEESASIYDQFQLKLKIETENLRPFRDPKPTVIFVAMEAEAIRITSLLNPDKLIINVLEDNPDVHALCLRNVLHIMPSQLMREAAQTIWKGSTQKKSKNLLTETEAWNSNYRRGTAGEMNDKFIEKRSTVLSEQGWAGWIAGRSFLEAYNTFKNTDQEFTPNNFMNFIKTMSFEAHKSERVRFRHDGQLIQSLLITSEEDFLDEILTEGDEDRFGPSLCQ